MTKTLLESERGGFLCDEFGRRELAFREVNSPLLETDIPEGGTYKDGDGRECVIAAGELIFGEGTSQTVFTPDPGAQLFTLRKGTSAAPDTTYSPLMHISRTLSVKESAFEGDGSPGLGSAYFVTKALVSSEGQAIGGTAAAVTEGTHTGAHSSADAVGWYMVGEATGESTRVGIGGFAAGRRSVATAQTTGMEIVSFNGTETAGKYIATGASDTKGIWLHATGKKQSGVGLQIGRTSLAFEVGIGINEGAVSAASFRDDSQSQFSIRVRGSHAKAAFSVLKGAGVVLLGSETEVATEAAAILETPFLRINETGLHLNGGTPVAIKAAGAETTAAIWARLKELGACT